jgi:hypothetical protein
VNREPRVRYNIFKKICHVGLVFAALYSEKNIQITFRTLGYSEQGVYSLYVPGGDDTDVPNTTLSYLRFQVLTAASMKFRIVFWDILLCKIIVDRRLKGTCCLHHQGRSSQMMKASLTSETSVDNYFTRQYIPEDNSELQLFLSVPSGLYIAVNHRVLNLNCCRSWNDDEDSESSFTHN